MNKSRLASLVGALIYGGSALAGTVAGTQDGRYCGPGGGNDAIIVESSADEVPWIGIEGLQCNSPVLRTGRMRAKECWANGHLAAPMNVAWRFAGDTITVDGKAYKACRFHYQSDLKKPAKATPAAFTRQSPPPPKALPPDGLSAQDYLTWIYEPYPDHRPSVDVEVADADKLYGKRLSKEFRDAVAYARAGNGPGGLSGDPFVNAVEWDIRDLHILTVPKGDDLVEGVVSFKNMSRRDPKVETVKLDLVKQGAGWRIDEIRFPDGRLYSQSLATR